MGYIIQTIKNGRFYFLHDFDIPPTVSPKTFYWDEELKDPLMFTTEINAHQFAKDMGLRRYTVEKYTMRTPQQRILDVLERYSRTLAQRRP